MKPVIARSILWRRLDRPGHESARLFARGSRWHLHGTAVFLHAGRACRLDYQVACTARWKTVSTRVTGWVGDRPVSLDIVVDPAGRWRVNGTAYPAVAGCTDIDLNFSPVTNLLPIRRVPLRVGQESAVRAAWLRFPSFALEPLDQTYRRLGPRTYRYESAGGRFVARLTVDDVGFVTHYPKAWRTEGALA